MITPLLPHLVIESENLEWLKNQATINTYNLIGNVDVVYVDPPYNTGNNEKSGFTYNDKQAHDAWIKFMEERFIALKPFLTESSVILVSIDDSEVHYLRVLMDGIFGRKNFIAQIIVDGGANKNNANFFSVTHEYVIVYGVSVARLKKNKTKWRQKREGVDALFEKYEMLKSNHKSNTEITSVLKEWVKTQPFSKRLKVFYNADDKGLYTYADLSVPGNRYVYTVKHPITGKTVQEPSRGWGISEEKFWLLDEDGLIIWGTDETKQPLKKLYLSRDKDQLMKSVLAYPARTPTHELEKMLGKRGAFNNPKNLQLIKDLIDYVAPKEGTILDIFGGTGTTGHAVLELNATDSSNRRFVVVTKNENEIYSTVTKPRIEKAIELIVPDREVCFVKL